MIPLRRRLPVLFLALSVALGRAPVRAAAPPDNPLPVGARCLLGTRALRHDGPVTAVAFLPNGDVRSASRDGTLRTWRTATGRQLSRRPFEGAEAVVAGLARGGTMLVLGKPNGAVYLVDAATARRPAPLLAPAGLVGLALSPDGATLISVNQDRKMLAWDVASRKELRRYDAAPVAGDVAFAPDGKHFAWSGEGSSAHLTDVLSGKEVRSFLLPPGERGRNSAPQRGNIGTGTRAPLAFSPDGKLLAATAGGASAHVWDARTGKHRARLNVEGAFAFEGTVRCLAFAPGGRFLAAGCKDGSVRLWGLATGKELRRLEGASGPIHSLAFSPDGKSILAAGQDHTVHLWGLAGERELHRGEGHVGAIEALHFLPNGRRLVSAGSDGAVRLWDTTSGRHLGLLAEHPSAVTALTVTREPAVLSMSFTSGAILVWHPDTGRERRRTGRTFGGSCPMLFTPDGGSLVLGFGGTVSLTDTTSAKELRKLDVPREGWIVGLCVSPDGRRLATAEKSLGLPGGPRSVRVWDLVSGKLVGRVASGASADGPATLAFAPDGRTLACLDGGARVWETATGVERARFLHPEKAPETALAYSPDGRLLAVASAGPGLGEGAIRFLDATTGQLRGQAQGRWGPVRALAFSDDGKSLASGGADSTILVWDVARLVGKRPPPTRFSAKDLDACWRDLGGADGRRAHRAIRSLAVRPAQSVPLLADRLKAPAGPARLARLLRDLDDDEFEVRESASRELGDLGPAIEGFLKNALAETKSLEPQRRLKALLDRPKTQPGVLEQARFLRAIEVLEQAGTPEARKALRRLAEGDAAALLKQEARSSLDRLGERP